MVISDRSAARARPVEPVPGGGGRVRPSAARPHGPRVHRDHGRDDGAAAHGVRHHQRRAVVDGDARAAYALARPPGHHAATDSYAGYCFLNNAAIAAALWAELGARVAILDVDYHHGNGTQATFYDRSDVCFVSLHADPAHEYPFFAGFASERGAGAGHGSNHNLPLPLGTAWDGFGPALGSAAEVVRHFAADALVVSLGVDTAAEDDDTFQLVGDDFTRIGTTIGHLDLPTVFVQEGGYNLDVIGRNVTNVLRGFDNA